MSKEERKELTAFKKLVRFAKSKDALISVSWGDEEGDNQDPDLGGTGHGDISASDADPGL